MPLAKPKAANERNNEDLGIACSEITSAALQLFERVFYHPGQAGAFPKRLSTLYSTGSM
jgi:hypothetical protein